MTSEDVGLTSDHKNMFKQLCVFVYVCMCVLIIQAWVKEMPAGFKQGGQGQN